MVMYGLFHLHRLDLRRLYPFEALAEIFDFVAGLVQRVPKKTNEMKSDLQNSTASQGDCSWVGILLYFFGINRLNIGQILRLTSFAQDDHVGLMTFYKGD